MRLHIIPLYVLAAPLFSATWVNNANGNWEVNASWAPPVFPNAVGAQAVFGNAITATRTITISGPMITVGDMQFNDNNNYIIAGNTLILDATVGNALLTVTNSNGNGAHSMTCPVTLNDSVTMSHTSTANFTISGAISGVGGIDRTGPGPGALVLSNTGNMYTGTTTITQGIITYGAAGAIRANNSVVIAPTGLTSQLTINAMMGSGNAFDVVVNTNGSVVQNMNQSVFVRNLLGSGTITLAPGGAATNFFTISPSVNGTFSGSIGGGIGSGNMNPTAANRLIKDGSATLVLTGASTYLSRTFIANGIISMQNQAALGPVGAMSAVYVRATGTQGSLSLDAGGMSVPKTLFLNGSGFSGGGALLNTVTGNTITGGIQIGWAGGPEIASDATIFLAPGTVLTCSGVISGSNNLTLTGGGSIVYSGASSNIMVAGTVTTIDTNTTLTLNKSAGLNAISGNATINAGGLLTLTAGVLNQIANTSVITLNGGTFNLQGNAETIGSLVFNTGTLTQGGGILSIDSVTPTALSLQDVSITGPIAFTAAGGVTYNGTGAGATISGTVNLGTTIHAFDIADSAGAAIDLSMSGAMSGTGGITKSTSAGVLEYTGSSVNTYSGLTTINAGILSLNKPAGTTAVQGSLTIGGTGTVVTQTDHQIATTSTVTVNSGGVLDVQSTSQSILQLVIANGGSVPGINPPITLNANAGANGLNIANGVTLTRNLLFTAVSGAGSTITDTEAGLATISGNIEFDARTHVISVSNAAGNLTISGVISGVDASVTSSGVGILEFTNTNTYTGPTLISTGNLRLNSNTGNAIIGDVNYLAGESSGSLTLVQPNQIGDNSTVTLNSATFNMNGQSDTILSFVYQSGTFTQAGGILSVANTSGNTALSMRGGTTISGTVNITQGGTFVFDNAVNGTATFSGILDLAGPTAPTFSVQMGTATIDLQISGQITGTQGFTKTGNGLVQLSGGASNSYGGLTTVTNGTVELFKTAPFIAIPGHVSITGGTLQLAAADQIATTATVTMPIGSNGTFNLPFSQSLDAFVFLGGTFTNAGTLTLLSSTTPLILRGNRTLSGPIVLQNGGMILFDSSGNGTSTLSGSLHLGATTPTFQTGNGTATNDMVISGLISSTGAGLTKIDTGRLLISGASSNTYTGSTTVLAGVLALGKTGGAIAIPGDVTVNGSGTLFLTMAEQIAVTSTMTLTGSGVFNMAGFAETMGALDFQGGTLSQGGALLSLVDPLVALSMRNTTIAGPIALTQGGDVVFDPTNNGTALIQDSVDLSGFTVAFSIGDGTADIDMSINGVISNGGLDKQGAGKLVLTGSNTYALGTVVTGGTLQGNSTSLQGNIIDNANLVFDQMLNGTYAGSISGTGTVVKQGMGDLILTNVSTIGGMTSVNAGTLTVNGTLGGAGLITVAPGARLQGTGTIAKDLTLHGILAPGNSIGTLHFEGTQVFATGSTFENEVNGVISDLVDIVGTLSIQPGVTLQIITEPGHYPPDSIYTIVQTTGGVSGTFSSVLTPSIFFDETVLYTPLEIILELELIPFSERSSGNALAVARCLDRFNDLPGDIEAVIHEIRLLSTFSLAAEALNQMQPSLFTDLAIAKEDDLLYASNAILNRLDLFSHSCDQLNNKRGHFWTTLLGGLTTQNGKSGEPGFHVESPGVTIGFDGAIGKQGCLGISLSYLYSYLDWRQSRGNAKIQGGLASLYGKWFGCLGYLEGIVTGGYDRYKTIRHIHFGAIQRTAQGSHGGFEGSGHLKGALTWNHKCTIFSPFGRAEYIYVHENTFHESGAQVLNLTVQSKNSDLLSTEVGFDLAHCFRVKEKQITPFLQGSVIWENRFMGGTEKALFKGCLMTVKGLNPSRTLVGVEAGCNALFPNPKSEFSLFFRGRYGDGFKDSSLYLQFAQEF